MIAVGGRSAIGYGATGPRRVYRRLAETSPYMEAFKRSGSDTAEETEVLYMYSAIDDFMMNNLHEFSGRKLVTVEVSDVAADTAPTDKKADAEKGM